MKLLLALIFICFAVPCWSQPIELENYKKYSGSCISSAKFFQPGRFVFDLKASKTSGTIFCAYLTDNEVSPSEDASKHLELGFELIGHTIEMIKCVAVLPGKKYFIEDVPLGFDASAEFHRYEMVQKPDAVEWLVDGKVVYSVGIEQAKALAKPMRLFVNFRPAVSHCDDSWGCIRNAELPTHAYMKSFSHIPEISLIAKDDSTSFGRVVVDDKFAKFETSNWQNSPIDLIKGNKPLYPAENVSFAGALKMQINRDSE